MQNGWTSGEEQTVRDMCEKGHTAREIAAALLNRTRNSVIGFCHRKKIKLPREAPPRYPAMSGGERRKRSSRRKLQAERKTIHPLERSARIPYTPTVLIAVDASWVSFWELNNQHCRWPGEWEGKRVFCGREKFLGSSYCAEHTWQSQWHGGLERRRFYAHHKAAGINQQARTKVGDSPEPPTIECKEVEQ